MGIEIAEIFRLYGKEYRQKHDNQIPFRHRKAMRAIERCRTEALGGQVYRCPKCEHTLYSYHSCRNRHCPKCQNKKAHSWLEKQEVALLPVPYFFLTFTLPNEISRIARSHQSLIYNLLFRISAAATQELAADERFVGGKLGMIGVLHTWGRNLIYHPHVHYLVPAGGLASDGTTWLSARKNFLVPVRALSRLFRGKFHQALKAEPIYDLIPAEVWTRDWVVHCEPVGTGEGALKYLAPYIFRVAITNNRVLKLEDDHVTFRYRDTVTKKERRCTIHVHEFIRRFLQHVLPKGFVKVRYYGFFSPGLRKSLARLHQHLSNLSDSLPGQKSESEASTEIQGEAVSAILCPSCGCTMRGESLIEFHSYDPP